MTRSVRRWVGLFLLLTTPVVFGQPGRPSAERERNDQPNAETLRRLAQQLQGGNQPQPDGIDPELMRLAAEYLKKNPDVLQDPQFQQQLKQMQQQAKADPDGFARQMKQQNPGLTPQQIESLKQQLQQPKPAVPPPPPIPGPMPPAPDRPDLPRPNGNGPRPVPNPPAIPPGQQNPFNPNSKFPTPPDGQWQDPAQKAQAKPEYQQVVGLWENNFGSIEKTPALKQSLVDMFSGEGKGPGGEWGNGGNPWGGPENGGGNSKPFWDTGSGPDTGSQSGLVSWLKNSTSGGPPSWWKNMTNWNQTPSGSPNLGSGWNPPQSSGGSGFGGGGGGGGFDLSSGAWPVVIFVGLIAVAVAGFVVWRYWPKIVAMRSGPKPVAGLGAWTIDPRDVVDRETLVKAFDYLSVLICGDGARVWNHQTIADAFRENVPGAAPFADPLALLYALARYSPANEPIAAADIAAARGYLCRLAEVPA